MGKIVMLVTKLRSLCSKPILLCSVSWCGPCVGANSLSPLQACFHLPGRTLRRLEARAGRRSVFLPVCLSLWLPCCGKALHAGSTSQSFSYRHKTGLVTSSIQAAGSGAAFLRYSQELERALLSEGQPPVLWSSLLRAAGFKFPPFPLS